MYLQINRLFLHERALTVAPKHKKLPGRASPDESLGLWLSIENCSTLIKGCGHFNDRLPYLCPTIFNQSARRGMDLARFLYKRGRPVAHAQL